MVKVSYVGDITKEKVKHPEIGFLGFKWLSFKTLLFQTTLYLSAVVEKESRSGSMVVAVGCGKQTTSCLITQ